MSDQEARQAHLRQEYMSRINRVIDHIEANMDSELKLEALAQVANFSRFHFHRLFGALVGETLNNFIQRIRMERAASQLVANPHKPITHVALDCGFGSSAAFARVFKEHFQMSASEWRAAELSRSKIRQADSNHMQHLSKGRKAGQRSLIHIDWKNNQPSWRIEMKDNKGNERTAEVEVKELSELNVAYVRHIGPYKGDGELFAGLFMKLMAWAGPRDLLGVPGMQVLAVYHDNPDITDEERLRTSVCITVPEGTEVNGEVGSMRIPGGKFAVARFELAEDEYEEAWNAVMGGWLPESGYQPDDRLCYERFHNNPKEHPEGKCILDICIPVKPL